MHVGVTGASGLIGRSLVSALNGRGDVTTAFIRPATKSSAGAVIRWDPERREVDEGELRRAGGFDAVVHLAGAGVGDRRWTQARRREILGSRVRTTSLLAEALFALPQGVEFLASGSATGWYGDRGEEELDETSSPGTGFLSDVCRQWEDATLPLERAGATVAHLRTGVVVSSLGGALRKQLPLFRRGLGGRLGDGQQWMSPISLRDEVRAILWLIDHRVHGPINLVAPQATRNEDFAKALARELHRPAFFNVPSLALKALLGQNMAEELVLVSQRVSPQRLMASGFIFDHSDVATALHWALHSETGESR